MLTSHGTDITRQWDLIVVSIPRVVLSAINKSLISTFFFFFSSPRVSSIKLQPGILKSFASTEDISREILGSLIR